MAEEAGEVASCPQCGQEVKLHSMIPVLDGEGPGHRYLCRECARALIPDEATNTPAADGEGNGGTEDGDAQADGSGGEAAVPTS